MQVFDYKMIYNLKKTEGFGKLVYKKKTSFKIYFHSTVKKSQEAFYCHIFFESLNHFYQ